MLARSPVCFKFYNFFLVQKPFKEMKLTPIDSLKQQPQTVTQKERIQMALKPKHLPNQVIVCQVLFNFVLLTSLSVAVTQMVQWNDCVSHRETAKNSYSCLNEGVEAKDPYAAGALVGLGCAGLMFGLE